jgi:hypothetical protein
MSEEWTEEHIKEINEEMASGALLAIQELLDSGGIPRGTFADDQVRNLVALYNQRGDALQETRCQINMTARPDDLTPGFPWHQINWSKKRWVPHPSGGFGRASCIRPPSGGRCSR